MGGRRPSYSQSCGCVPGTLLSHTEKEKRDVDVHSTGKYRESIKILTSARILRRYMVLKWTLYLRVTSFIRRVLEVAATIVHNKGIEIGVHYHQEGGHQKR